MDNYKEVLEYLIGLKKTKKEPNKLERDMFAEAWQKLVSVEGYSEFADTCLYNGFTYCGASVVMQYVKSTDNSVEALRKVFSGSMYGKNCASTVPILFHLLALLLNEKHTDLLLISEVIKKIPSALKNKEGKIYGQADRALKKYILDVLHSETLPTFEALTDSGLKNVFVEEFMASLDEIIFGMKVEGFSKKCRRNIKILNAWVHPVQNTNTTAEDQSVSTSEETQNVSTSETQSVSTSEETSEIQSDGSVSKNLLDNAPEVHTESPEESHLELCETKLREATESLVSATNEVEHQRKQIAQMRQQISELEAEIARLGAVASAHESRTFSLTGELSSTKKEVMDLQLQIEQLERELQERIKMTEALSRDRAKQSDEALNRLASKLRIEYRDFMDAIDVPMDSDLGENMREQLKNVFSILIKAGIAIN